MRARLFFGVVGVAVASLAFATSATGVGTTTPFTSTFFNTCTGEAFVAEGTIQTSADFTIGPDGRVHGQSHVNLQARTAKGVVTGAKYVVQQTVNEGQNSDFDAAPSTQHFIFQEHYVRSGENGALIDDDDFYLSFHLQLTINANGVPTVERIESNEDTCR
jgi:hypothetical protein